MKRTRVLFLSVSMGVLMLFSGVLLANRSSQDVLFRALGNLAEVVAHEIGHLVLPCCDLGARYLRQRDHTGATAGRRRPRGCRWL